MRLRTGRTYRPLYLNCSRKVVQLPARVMGLVWVVMISSFANFLQAQDATISGSATVCLNGPQPDITFTWNKSGNTPPYTFVYTVNDGSEQSATTTSGNSVTVPVSTSALGVFVFKLIRANDATNYSISVTGTATITVTDAPSISTSPQPVTTGIGCSASFSVTATGTGPFTYQWRKGGSNITGATSATYSIPTVSATDAGNYDVVVSNSCGDVTSSVAALTVNAPLTAGSHNVDAVTACSNYNPPPLTVSAPTGGSPGYTYQWLQNGAPVGTNSATYDPDNLIDPGTYTINVRITDACGTVVESEPKTITIVADPTVSIGGATSYCQGESATLTATVTNGTGTIGYQWFSSPDGSSWTSISGASGSTYTPPTSTAGSVHYQVKVTVNGSACNNARDEVVVNVNALPTIFSVSGGGSYCAGGTGVQVGLSGSETGVQYQLKLNNVSVGSAVNGTGGAISFGNQTTAGTYTVVATNASTSCTANMNGSADVVVNPLPTVSLSSQTNVLCFGASTGAINITAGGGTGALSYTWNGTGVNASAEDQTGLKAGTYSVVVTDSKGCASAELSVTLTEPSQLTASVASQTNVSCHGGNDGAISVSASGGTAPYTYSKDGSNFSSTASFSGLTAVNYTITVKDNNGCTTTVPVSITEPAAITIAANVSSNYNGSQLSCATANDGQISVTATGGTGALEYSKDGGATWQSSNVFNGLGAGSYQIKVKDANGCTTAATSVSITAPSAVTINSATKAAYNGADLSCASATDGQITIAATGGTGTLQYSKDGGTTWQSSNVFNGLGAGSYQIKVKDANGCTTVVTIVTIATPAPVTIGSAVKASYNGADLSCATATDGQITVTATGGTGALEYSKDNGASWQTSNVFSNLAAGTYQIKVKDANNCTTTATSVTITAPAAVTISSAVKASYNGADLSCATATDGQITVTATGGTGTLAYSKDNGGTWQASNVFSNLAAGTYEIKVKDANNCTTTATSVTITAPAAVTISSAVKASYNGADLSCATANDGQVTVTATGGTGTLAYSKDNGATWQASNVFSNLAAGTYEIKVKDANNCTTTATSVTITAPAAVTISSTSKASYNGADLSCATATDGQVTVTATGGTGTLEYSKDNGATWQASNVFSNLTAGTYQIKVKDANNCTTTATSVIITAPTALTIGTPTVTNVSCFGGSDGKIVVSVTGGSGSIVYSISPNTGAQSPAGTFNNLPAGNYTITATDQNGCIATKTVSITQPTAVTITSIASNSPICSGANLSLTSSASGGTGGLSYSWTGPNGFTSSDENPSIASATTAASGNYDLTVTDGNSCTATASVSVTVNPLPTPTLNSSEADNTICAGEAVTFTAGGGTNYEFFVNGVSKQNGSSSTYTTTSLTNGQTVTVKVTDANGCAATSTGITTTVNPLLTPSVNISPSANNICAGTSVKFTASAINGGTNPSYQWYINGNPAGSGGNTFTSATLANGDKVTVQMTSDAVCPNPETVTSNTVTMAVNALVTPSVTIAPNADNICPGTNVTFTATAINGGNAPTYQWYVDNVAAGGNSSSFSTSTLTDDQVVKVVITSNATCPSQPTAEGSYTINVLPAPVPSVSVAASANNICPGTSVTFTATPTNGGSPSYQWYVNGSPAGTNSATFTSSTLNNNDVVKVVMTSTATCAAPKTVEASVNMTVLPAPVPTVTVAANDNVCPGTTINFTATPNNGGTAPAYQWYVGSTAVGTNSPSFSSSTLNNGDVVKVVMTSNEACANPTTANGSVTVKVLPAAPVMPGAITGPSKLCINSGNQNYSISSVTNATTYTWTVPSGWSIVSGQGTTSLVVSTSGTAVSGNVTVTAGNSCGTSSAQNFAVAISTGPPATPGSILGASAVCPAKTLIYAIEDVAGADSYTWSFPANWTITQGQGTTTVTVQVPVNAAAGSVSVIAKNVCGNSAASTLDVAVGSVGVDAGPDQTVCSGTTQVTLAGSVTGIKNANEWDWVIPAGTSVADDKKLNTTFSFPGITSGTVTVKLVSNQTTVACPVVQDQMVITIKPLPTASISVTGTNPICAGGSSVVTFTATPNTTVSYKVNGGSTQTISVGASGSATLNATNLSATTTYSLVSVAYPGSPSCVTTVSGSAVVNVTPLPAVNAGGPDVICQSASPTALTLSGASVGGSATTGAWSIISGGGSLSNTAQTGTPASVTYTPAANFSGAVVLRLTTNAPSPCAAVYAERTITVNQLPTANAGGPDVVCQSATPTAITLTGASIGGSATTGAWSITSGSGTLSSTAQTSNPSTVTFTPAANFSGNVVLTLTTNAASPCSPATATRMITVNPLPTVSAGTAQTICSNTTATMNGSFGGGASSASWSTSGSGSFSNNSPTAVYTPSAADINNGTVTLTYTTDDPNGPCGAVSASMTLTIKKQVTITSQPSNLNVCAGSPADLSVSAVGDGLSYQWYKGTAPGGTAVSNSGTISGAQTPTLHFSTTSATDNGSYYVVISGTAPCSPVTSEQRTLSVDQAITITQQPQAQTHCEGETASFSVGADANGAPLTYQWRKDGVNIPGANSSTLTLNNITTAGAGSYDVVVSGPSGYTCSSLTSSAATLTVKQHSTITLSQGPDNQSVCINTAVSPIKYSIGGGGTGASITAGSLPPGMTGSFSGGQFVISGAPTQAGTFNYTVTTTGDCNNVSASGSLTVSPASVGGTLSPQVTPACGGTNSGTISLSGQTGSVIRWESSTNGGGTWTPIGNTSTSLSYTNLAQTTLYRAVVQSGPCGVAYSTTAVVTVTPPVAPTATASPTQVCLGQSANLSANANLPKTWSDFDATFNQANPAGWRVTENGSEIIFPANADNASTFPWSETNGPKTPFTGITYNNLQSDGKFAIASGQIKTTLETPVFSTLGMTSATLQFFQALVFEAGTTGKIEISTDGGVTYTTLQVYTGPLTIGDPATNWAALNIDLTNYLGLNNLRIRFNYDGVGNSNWALDGLKLQPPGPTVTYNWTLIDPSGVPSPYYLNATDQASVVATPTAPGTYTYQVATTVGGCPGGTANVVVTVKPLPTCEISGPTSVCPGSSAVFSGPATSGYTYKWTITGGGTISGSTTSQNVTVNANNSCGSYTLTLITTLNGCSSSACTYTVNVADTEKPVVSGQATIPGLGCNPSSPTDAFITPTVTDNCPSPVSLKAGYPVTSAVSTVNCSSSQTRTWVYVDACGNESLPFVQTISWTTDVDKPVITLAPAATLNCNPSAADVAAAFGAASVTDNCSTGLTATGTVAAEVVNGCQVSVTKNWTVTDACGNTGTASQTISFTRDNTAPTVTGQANVTSTQCNVQPAFIDPTPADNCGTPTLKEGYPQDGTVTAGANCMSTQTRTWIYVDACGNESVPFVQTATWKADKVPPTVTCPTVPTLCEVPGNTYIIPDLTASDNCTASDALTITYKITGVTQREGTGVDASGVFNVGVSTITWTVTDECGNTSTCTTQVTVDPKPTPTIYHN